MHDLKNLVLSYQKLDHFNWLIPPEEKILLPLFLADKNLKNINGTNWLMPPGEQMALTYFLQNLKPKVSIEIGTYLGGSLQIISHFSSRVYTLDADPEVPHRLAGKYSNVDYIIGDSAETLPLLLKKLEKENAEVSFIFVDGDHSSEAVKRDLEAILGYTPQVPLYVLMHDSFYPPTRQGLSGVDWSSSPYVHAVELDYLVGFVHQQAAMKGNLWAGLALAILLPEPRKETLKVSSQGGLSHQRLLPDLHVKYEQLEAEIQRLKKQIVGERVIQYISNYLHSKRLFRILLKQPFIYQIAQKMQHLMKGNNR